MSDAPRNTPPEALPEVTSRNRIARYLAEGFFLSFPADIWRYIATAFAHIPALSTEITRLRAELAGARLDCANLAAAGRHVDYGRLQEESRRVGALGEELVMAYERYRLRDAGRPDLAGTVQWVAKEIGDGLGYDVLSFELSGEELYIEVKSTSLAAETPFYFSSAELDFARRHLQTYALYRVSQVDDSPQFFVLRGPEITNLEMVPVTYQARLPRGSPNGTQTPDASS